MRKVHDALRTRCAMRDVRMRCAMRDARWQDAMRDGRMRCAMAGCDARCQDAMLGCYVTWNIASCHRASHPDIAHRILTSHPAIAHRILPSRIASCHRASHPSIAHRILASHPSIAHRILPSRIALHVISGDTMVLLGHHINSFQHILFILTLFLYCKFVVYYVLLKMCLRWNKIY